MGVATLRSTVQAAMGYLADGFLRHTGASIAPITKALSPQLNTAFQRPIREARKWFCVQL